MQPLQRNFPLQRVQTDFANQFPRSISDSFRPDREGRFAIVTNAGRNAVDARASAVRKILIAQRKRSQAGSDESDQGALPPSLTELRRTEIQTRRSLLRRRGRPAYNVSTQASINWLVPACEAKVAMARGRPSRVVLALEGALSLRKGGNPLARATVAILSQSPGRARSNR